MNIDNLCPPCVIIPKVPPKQELPTTLCCIVPVPVIVEEEPEIPVIQNCSKSLIHAMIFSPLCPPSYPQGC